MGAQHSTHSPTDADFLVKHKPMPSNLFERSPLVEYSFRVPRKAWRKKTISVEGMDVVLKADGKPHCILSGANGEMRAVLQVISQHQIQVCSLTPPEKGVAAVGEYKGRPLYEYGVVSRDRLNRQLLILRTVSGITFQTESCGSCMSRQGISVMKRDGIVCASLTKTKEQSEKLWDCRVGPGGMEPTLCLAFLACHDKFPQIDEDFLRDSSGMKLYKIGNIL